MTKSVDSDRRSIGFVEDGKHGDHIFVLILRDELGQSANDVEGPLGVGDTHDSVEEVDAAELARVVVAVLGSGDGVQIEIDAKSVLASPFERFEEVGPADVCEERLSIPDLSTLCQLV